MSDKTAMVGVAITFVSACISLYAIKVAIAALRAQLAAPASERKNAAYYALVAQPAMDIIPAAVRTGIRTLERGSERIKSVVAGGGTANQARQEFYATKKAYSDALWPLMHRLGVASRAWGNAEFHKAVTDARLRLEDDVWPHLMQFPVGAGDAEAMVEALHAAEADLLALIIHHDPTVDVSPRRD